MEPPIPVNISIGKFAGLALRKAGGFMFIICVRFSRTVGNLRYSRPGENRINDKRMLTFYKIKQICL